MMGSENETRICDTGDMRCEIQQRGFPSVDLICIKLRLSRDLVISLTGKFPSAREASWFELLTSPLVYNPSIRNVLSLFLQ